MKSLISNINEIFSDIPTLIKNNPITMRHNKLDIRDAILYKFLYSKIDNTKSCITSHLNMNNNKSCDRTSYYRKENNISSNLYKAISDNLHTLYKTNFCKSDELSTLAVDGTYMNINNPRSHKLMPTLNIGIYDATNEFPIELKYHTKNDRNIEISNIKKYICEHKLTNVILVADRAYFSYDFINFLMDKKINFIVRIKNNCKLMDPKYKANKYDKNHDLINKLKNKIRFVKCSAKTNKTLHKKDKTLIIKQQIDANFVTNLMDKQIYDDKKITALYKQRWEIETFFKFVKSNFKFSHLKEKNDESNKKTILCDLILSQIVHLFINQYIKDNKNKHIKVNKSLLIHGIYDHVLKNIIYGNLTSDVFDEYLKCYMKIVTNSANRSFQRKSKIPFAKWYVKGYHEVYKYDALIDNEINGTHLNKNLNVLKKYTNIKFK